MKLRIFNLPEGDDDLDNQLENGSSETNQQNDNRQGSMLEKLKFEVAQEMGIKPKAKNKKN